MVQKNKKYKRIALTLIFSAILAGCNNGNSESPIQKTQIQSSNTSKPQLKAGNGLIIVDNVAVFGGLTKDEYFNLITSGLTEMEIQMNKLLLGDGGIENAMRVWLTSPERAKILTQIELDCGNFKYGSKDFYLQFISDLDEIALKGSNGDLVNRTARLKYRLTFKNIAKNFTKTLKETREFVRTARDLSLQPGASSEPVIAYYPAVDSYFFVVKDRNTGKLISKSPDAKVRAVRDVATEGSEVEELIAVERGMKAINGIKKANKYALILVGAAGAGIGVSYLIAAIDDAVWGASDVDLLNNFFENAVNKIVMAVSSDEGGAVINVVSGAIDGNILTYDLAGVYAISAIADAAGGHGNFARAIKFGNDVTGVSLSNAVGAMAFEKAGLGASIALEGGYVVLLASTPVNAILTGVAYGVAYTLGYMSGNDDSFANEITDALASPAGAVAEFFSTPPNNGPYEANIRYTQYKPLRPELWNTSYNGKQLLAICTHDFYRIDDFDNYGGSSIKMLKKSNLPYDVCKTNDSSSNIIPFYYDLARADTFGEWDLRNNWRSDGFNSFKVSLIAPEVKYGPGEQTYGKNGNKSDFDANLIIPGLNQIDDVVTIKTQALFDKAGMTYPSSYISKIADADGKFANMYKEGNDWIAYSAANNGYTAAITRFVMPNMNLDAESMPIIHAYDAKIEEHWHNRPLNLVAINSLVETDAPGPNHFISPLVRNGKVDPKLIEVYTQSSPGTLPVQIIKDEKDGSKYIASSKQLNSLYKDGQDCPSLSKVCFSKVPTYSQAIASENTGSMEPALFTIMPSGMVKKSSEMPKFIKDTGEFKTNGFGYVRFIITDPYNHYIESSSGDMVVPASPNKVAYRLTLPIVWNGGRPYLYAPGDNLYNIGFEHVVYNPKTLSWDNDNLQPVINGDMSQVLTYDGETGTLSFQLVDLNTPPVGSYLTAGGENGVAICQGNPSWDSEAGNLTANCDSVVRDKDWLGGQLLKKFSLPYDEACKPNSKVGLLYSNDGKNIVGLKCDDPWLPHGSYLNDIDSGFMSFESAPQDRTLHVWFKPDSRLLPENESATLEYGKECAANSTVSAKYTITDVLHAGKVASMKLTCDTPKSHLSASDLQWDDGVPANNPNGRCSGLSWTNDSNGDLWLKADHCNVTAYDSNGKFVNKYANNLSLNTADSCKKGDFVSLNFGKDPATNYLLPNWDIGMVKLECKSTKSRSN